MLQKEEEVYVQAQRTEQAAENLESNRTTDDLTVFNSVVGDMLVLLGHKCSKEVNTVIGVSGDPVLYVNIRTRYESLDWI